MMKLVIIVLMMGFATQSVAETSITKDSITWTFDGDYQVGQFVSGDWYVVAPSGLQISAITPAPANNRGTVLNPRVENAQGFTNMGSSNKSSYSPEMNVGLNLPIPLSPNDFLISTTDHTYNNTDKTYIDEAAVLTVLGAEPSPGSFRPGLNDPDHIIYNMSQVDYDRFQNVEPVGTPPTVSVVAGWFNKGPWLDYKPSWTKRYITPIHNLDDYWDANTRNLGEAAILLNTNISRSEKEEILKGFLQVGIDYYSILKHPDTLMHWSADGGIFKGRKLPILIAGEVLHIQGIKHLWKKTGAYRFEGAYGNTPSDYLHFQEDDQTFYVTQRDIDHTALPMYGGYGQPCEHGAQWCPDDRGGTPARYTATHLGMPEWAVRHYNVPISWSPDVSWLANYRNANNGRYFGATALPVIMMRLETTWNHPAFFDYTDRYMAISRGHADPFGYSVPNENAGWAVSEFVGKMWDVYRKNYANLPIRADVDQNTIINSIDALLTLRNAQGLNMASTNWQASATTGDVNCDEATDATDARLILRYNLGLSTSGTKWCN